MNAVNNHIKIWKTISEGFGLFKKSFKFCAPFSLLYSVFCFSFIFFGVIITKVSIPYSNVIHNDLNAFYESGLVPDLLFITFIPSIIFYIFIAKIIHNVTAMVSASFLNLVFFSLKKIVPVLCFILIFYIIIPYILFWSNLLLLFFLSWAGSYPPNWLLCIFVAVMILSFIIIYYLFSTFFTLGCMIGENREFQHSISLSRAMMKGGNWWRVFLVFFMSSCLYLLFTIVLSYVALFIYMILGYFLSSSFTTFPVFIYSLITFVIAFMVTVSMQLFLSMYFASMQACSLSKLASSKD